MKKTILVVLSVLLLALGVGFGGYTLKEEHNAKAQLEAARLAQARADQRLREMRAKAAQLHRDQVAIGAKHPQPASSASRISRQTKDEASQRARGPNALARAIATHPDLRALSLKAFRANLPVRFGDMYKTLNMTPDQIQKFEDLATAHEDDRETLYASALAQGLDPETGDVAALHDQYMNQYYTSLGADLSPAIQAAVQQLDADRNRTLGLGGMVDTVNVAMDSDAVPLTAAQRNQLVAMMAELSPSYENGGAAKMADVDWTAAQAQAASILSGSQLQAFNSVAQMMQLNAKVQQFYGPTKPH